MMKFIDRYDVISFDIFDTLLSRDVEEPTCIFELAASSVLDEQNAKEFRKNRRDAERNARNKRADKEVVLSEIYDELEPIYGSIAADLLREEINCEILHCFPVKKFAELLKESVKRKKQVFLISDMYLPLSVIIQMLDRCGISGYEKIYISGEYRCNKVTGQLFEKVIADNCIERKKMLHIGDSFIADVKGAYKAGIKAKWVFNAEKYLRRVRSSHQVNGK